MAGVENLHPTFFNIVILALYRGVLSSSVIVLKSVPARLLTPIAHRHFYLPIPITVPVLGLVGMHLSQRISLLIFVFAVQVKDAAQL